MRLFGNVRGRLARPASVRWNLLKTLLQSQTMWTIFFFIVPAAIYRLEGRTPLRAYQFGSPRWRAAGVALFVLGGIMAYVSAYFIVAHGEGTPLPADATRKLVVVGTYRYVRNPMALTSFAQGLGVAMYRGSPLIVLYVLVGMVGWNYVLRPWEEADLEWRFGEAYAHYRDHLRCWIPHLRPYQPPRTNGYAHH